jgi:hypothetical protein
MSSALHLIVFLKIDLSGVGLLPCVSRTLKHVLNTALAGGHKEVPPPRDLGWGPGNELAARGPILQDGALHQEGLFDVYNPTMLITTLLVFKQSGWVNHAPSPGKLSHIFDVPLIMGDGLAGNSTARAALGYGLSPIVMSSLFCTLWVCTGGVDKGLEVNPGWRCPKTAPTRMQPREDKRAVAKKITPLPRSEEADEPPSVPYVVVPDIIDVNANTETTIWLSARRWSQTTKYLFGISEREKPLSESLLFHPGADVHVASSKYRCSLDKGKVTLASNRLTLDERPQEHTLERDHNNVNTAMHLRLDKIRQEHNLAKAVKLDDAEVPIHLWDKAVYMMVPLPLQVLSILL